jgi:hypothetical protein
MRALVLVLLILISTTNAQGESGRLGNIRPGMTRTDVAIELGRPADVRIDQETTLWYYPSSATRICVIKFVKQKVTQEIMKCDESGPSKEIASKSSYLLPQMNSDVEYQNRVKRYCGVPPKPQPGCQISPQCVNGGWEEVCEKK